MATLFVRRDGSGTHTEIAAAIYDAAVGDTIDIEAGTFNETVDLYKGVILQGAGMEATIIQGSITSNFVKSPGYTCALGSTTLNFASGTTGLLKGRLITGTGIPANARIASVSANSITISAPTTAARSTATNATMLAMTDATVRVRSSGPQIKNLKVIGFDGPNPAVEHAAIYLRNTGNGSAACSNYRLENVHAVAVGEYALLTDFAAGVSNGVVTGCKFSGKTFVGDNPGIGNQYSVPNVPRQLVVFQSANTGTLSFTDNVVEGITGGLTVDGAQSFNSAATIDVPGAVVEDNTFQTVSGYGYALRVRGANAIVRDNVIYAFGSYTSAGLLVSGAGSTNEGNQILNQGLVATSQASAGAPISIEMSKAVLKSAPKVMNDPVFALEENWELVTFIFKKQNSSQRLFSAFRDFEATKQMKLRPGMSSGNVFQLWKIIISKTDRTLLVLARDASEIENAASFDITLA